MEIGDITQIHAANITIAYDDQVWQNDMIFKDQNDCSMRRNDQGLSDHVEVLTYAFGEFW